VPRTPTALAATAATGLALTVAGLLGVGATSAAAAHAGSASHYTLTYAQDAFGHNRVVRWAPCVKTPTGNAAQVIRYKVKTRGVRSRIAFVKKGIAKLAAATGLKFRYAGTTHYIPRFGSGNSLAEIDQWLHTKVRLVVAWARQGHGAGTSNMLQPGSEAGVGTIDWESSGAMQQRITAGAVVLKLGTVGLRRGFGAGGTTGTLLLHELGHAVGLQHYGDLHQVMNPVLGSWSPAGYGAGDRTGLRKIGRPAGCMTGKTLPL
jgi:hypothetical protein